MTCVIGMERDGKVYMGADSQTSTAEWKARTKMNKVFFRDGERFLFGTSGSVRMNNLLHYALEIPYRNPEMSAEQYMVTDFINAVRATFRAGGWLYKDNDREWSGVFMVGYEGKLWIVDTDFQIARLDPALHCLGSGDQYAYGAMLALDALAPTTRIKAALEIAGRLCPSVGGPYYVEVLNETAPEAS